MTSLLHKTQRDLGAFFAPGTKRPRPAQKWGFYTGSSGTSEADATWHGPYPTRQEAQRAADAWEADNPMTSRQSPYPWCVERVKQA